MTPHSASVAAPQWETMINSPSLQGYRELLECLPCQENRDCQAVQMHQGVRVVLVARLLQACRPHQWDPVAQCHRLDQTGLAHHVCQVLPGYRRQQ